MAEPICEDEGTLQEWSPCTNLLLQIPLRVQKGIFSHDLNLTCIDVVSHYIALGTNSGLVYWYCRATNDLQRLRFENSNNAVTCVKIVSTVDYMIAAGTDRGNVTIFQIPKKLPDSLPESLKPKETQPHRFNINGLHSAPVTCIEWSQNGMRLFSGDKNGLVVLTEIDFYMHLSKSIELLNEQFEIVQLSYSQQILLISTTFRSIICDGVDKWKVHQVGTKERKILGRFGATFYKSDRGSVIYASRPGHRLWLSNTDGIVQQTLLFKFAIPSSYPKIQLINPYNRTESCDSSFGKLIQFGGNKLVAYNSEILYVLHPGAISIVSSLKSARKIIDLAANDDEIFILEGERSILRIGYKPDKYCVDMAEGSSRRRSFIFDEFASKLKETAMESFKKITSELIITPEQTSPSSPPVLADEALDLPPIVNLPPGSISHIIPEDNVEVYYSVDANNASVDNAISCNSCNEKPSEKFWKDKEFDEVISRPLRRRNPKKSKICTTVQGGQETESDTTSNASDERLVWGVANELSISEESNLSPNQSHSSFSILKDIPSLLPVNSSKTVRQESIQQGISKTPDDKSLTSLDTCDSVSENLMLTPEKFLEEQEKTFYRLANQDISLLDSYNSEKTDNMSISLNITPSSSSSSKISDNLQTNSEVSENVSMASECKTGNSQSTCNSQNNMLPLPKQLCFYNSCGDAHESASSSQDDKHTISATDSVSSENSLKTSGIDASRVNESRVVGEGDGQQLNVVGTSIDVEIHSSDSVRKLNITGFNTKEEDNGDLLLKESNSHNRIPNNSEQGYLFEVDQPWESVWEECHNICEEKPSIEEVNDQRTSVNPVDYVSSSGNTTLDRDLSTGFKPSSAVSNKEDLSHWLQYAVPGPIVCLAVSDNYIVCTNSKEQVYFSGTSGLSLSWKLLPYEASWVSLSNDSNIVWVLHKKNLRSLVDPPLTGPFSEDMMLHDSNVKFCALDNDNPEGWIIYTDGHVKCQRNLLGAPLGKPEEIPCDWLLLNVACWNGVVLAITCDESVVCKPAKEERFRSIMTPKPITSFVALGPDNLAWIVDDRNNIYFSDDFLHEEPHWWQIVISDYLFQNTASLMQSLQQKIKSGNVREHKRCTMIAANDSSVWVYDKFSNFVRVNKTSFTGYIWNKTGLSLSLPLVRWHSISANGIFENKGRIWLLSSGGDLFCSKPNCKKFQSLSLPCEEIRCISSSTDALWVLSSQGKLFSRLGLSGSNLCGNSWKELHLPETDDLHLTWISCGCDVAWGCDSHGRVFATIESPYHMTKNVFDSAWVEVEGQAKKGAQFEKVFVGPHLYMVWAIDNKQNVYVREGIFPHYQVGTGWVFVAGVEANMLTVSSTSVWALSSNGSVYCRCGISENNYIGDFWKQIPGNLKHITSSFTDGLWGIDHNNTVLQLSRKTKILTKEVLCAESFSDVMTSSGSS